MIRRENKTTYSLVASPFLSELEPIFQREGFEYELLWGDDIPEGISREVDLDGHKINKAVCCVKSHMNPEDVHELMLRLWHPHIYGDVSEF